MKKRKKLLAQQKTAADRMTELLALAEGEQRDMTADEQIEFDRCAETVDSVATAITNLDKMASATAIARRVTAAPVLPAVRPEAVANANIQIGPGQQNAATEIAAAPGAAQNQIPAAILYAQCQELNAFKDTVNGVTAAERAYRFGMWMRAANGIVSSQQYCQEHGMPLILDAVHQETVNTTGGYLVLPEFDRDIIKLRNLYGVIRQHSRITPMTSDTKERPRRTGGLTATFVGEGDAGTKSTGSWDVVKLIAKKLMVLTRISNDLSEDAIVNVADELLDEISYAFAKKEDEVAFKGTGLSTDGGIVGFKTRLTDVNGVDNGGGLILGAGDLMSEITLLNLNNTVSILPDFADGPTTAWFCHKLFYHSVMEKLLTAAGGNTVTNIEEGGRRRIFLGYPVVFTNAMPNSDAVSQVLCLLGDLKKASMFGDRRQNTIMFSPHATIAGESVFERDQIAVKGTTRFDFNAHDVGTATAAGPVVGLISAAS